MIKKKPVEEFSKLLDDTYSNIGINHIEIENKINNYCEECKIKMDNDGNDKYICNNCGKTNNIEETALKLSSNRIQIIGVNSSTSNCSISDKINEIYCKLCFVINKNLTLSEKIPGHILFSVAEKYVSIKKYSSNIVHIGRHKNGQLSALLLQECKSNNIIISPKDIIKIFNLKKSDLSKGNNKINSHIADKIIESNPVDENLSIINNILKEIKIESGLHKNITNIILEILEVVDTIHICDNSILKSKIVGIICLILIKMRIVSSLKEFCAKTNEKINTLKKVILELNTFNDNFIDIYQKYKLTVDIINL